MQVEQARQLVKHWQGEAERQAKLAQEAGSQEVKDKMGALQVRQHVPCTLQRWHVEHVDQPQVVG